MSHDMVYEEVPSLVKRSGEVSFSGANNSVIILGRDRNGRVDSGFGARNSSDGGKSAGSIHLIAGRSSENTSFSSDRASIVISMRSEVDKVSGTESIGGFTQNDKSAVMMRGDCIRISARNDLKISIGEANFIMRSNGTIEIDGKISLGSGARQRVIRADDFRGFWNSIVIPTPAGPSGPLPPLPENIFSRELLIL